jgi:hypothetical protein
MSGRRSKRSLGQPGNRRSKSEGSKFTSVTTAKNVRIRPRRTTIALWTLATTCDPTMSHVPPVIATTTSTAKTFAQAALSS